MSKVEFDCGKWLQEAEECCRIGAPSLYSLYMDQVMMFTGEALCLLNAMKSRVY